jgi:hypothetical protein
MNYVLKRVLPNGVGKDEYMESCDFSYENTNINLKVYHISVFMFDIRMINMSSECEYD